MVASTEPRSYDSWKNTGNGMLPVNHVLLISTKDQHSSSEEEVELWQQLREEVWAPLHGC